MPAISTATRYSCRVSPCHLSLGALAQISGSSLLVSSKQHRVVTLPIYIKQTSPSALASQTLMAGSGRKPVRNISNLIMEKMLIHTDCFILAADRLTQALLTVAVGWGLVDSRCFSVQAEGFIVGMPPFSLKENVCAHISDPPNRSRS